MCLLFFAYKMSPQYKLVVAANRDEFYSRPTRPLEYLDEEDRILCGRDLQSGGTWLGISSDLKFGAITNFRQGGSTKVGAPTRGGIIISYLKGNMSASDFLAVLSNQADLYEGFNLVLSDADSIYYFSNKRSGVQELKPGFYGLSNHLLETPWPKVTRGKELLRKYMVEQDKIDEEQIFDQLLDHTQPADDQLPDTGVDISWERLLATIFINSPGYGTRSSAVITVAIDGKIQFFEKTYDERSKKVGRSSLVKKTLNV